MSDSPSPDTVEHPDATGLLDLALRLYEQRRYREAHDHLDRAGAILRTREDAGLLARVDEARARLFLAEKKYREARRVIDRAVETLERGGGVAALAGALTTRGVVLARLGDAEGSVSTLRRAAELAEWAGDPPGAALAALTLIEEHGARRALPQGELYDLYLRADRLLGGEHHPDTAARRLACAHIVMRRLAGVEPGDKNFTFYGAVHEFEEKLIGWALEEAGGSVVRAARLLGLKHQTLSSTEPEAQEAPGEAHSAGEAAAEHHQGAGRVIRGAVCQALTDQRKAVGRLREALGPKPEKYTRRSATAPRRALYGRRKLCGRLSPQASDFPRIFHFRRKAPARREKVSRNPTRRGRKAGRLRPARHAWGG